MEFSNEHFLKLKSKKKIAMKNAGFFYTLSSESTKINKQLVIVYTIVLKEY